MAAGQTPQTTPSPPDEGQLLIAELPILLEQRTAQHARRRQALLPGRLDPVSAQVPCDQAKQPAVVVQPLRHRLELTADLVPGEPIEEAGLDRAFLAHCRLRRWQGCALTSVV
jgi:hypothetical protein